MSSSSSPAVESHNTKTSYGYSALVYFAAFAYAEVTPLIYLLAYRLGSSSTKGSISSPLSNPYVSMVMIIGEWLFFFALFYFIGRRVNFRRDYANLAILTYVGILSAYLVFQLAVQVAGGFGGGGFSSALIRQEIGDVVSAIAGFGLLFGAMSLAFLRTQLPFSDTPPLELVAYRNPSWTGLIALLASFASRVLSAFIAALLFQEGLFRQDQFSYLNYYFSTGDPLFVNFIIYPALFMVLLYYIGGKIDFHRETLRVSWYLFTGAFVGYAVGTPLGFYLKAFFNPPSGSSSSQVSQLYAITPQSVISSALDAVLLLLLGISMLTIALLLRRSDIPGDDADEGGEDEALLEEGAYARSSTADSPADHACSRILNTRFS